MFVGTLIIMWAFPSGRRRKREGQRIQALSQSVSLMELFLEISCITLTSFWLGFSHLEDEYSNNCNLLLPAFKERMDIWKAIGSLPHTFHPRIPGRIPHVPSASRSSWVI
jgi:hypothetical protein